MPTFQRSPRFKQDWKQLTPTDQQMFKNVIRDQFIPDLTAGRFRPQLGVQQFRSKPGVWEMAWGKNRRATFSYGEEQRPGHRHVIWRRIGTHGVYDDA